MEIPNIYGDNYKYLLIIPLALVVISLFYIPQIPRGIDFKGGILVTMQINGSFDEAAASANLRDIGIRDAKVSSYDTPVGRTVEVEIEQNDNLADAERVRPVFLALYDKVTQTNARILQIESTIEHEPGNESQYASTLEELRATIAENKPLMEEKAETILKDCETVLGPIPRDFTDAESLKELVEDSYSKATEAYNGQVIGAISRNVSVTSFSFSNVMPSLSEYFVSKVVQVLTASIILVIVFVFLVFRRVASSLVVLTGATSDILISLGAMGFFGIPLTLSSFAALLMLIGFSLDTDVLLTMRVYKLTEGTPRSRAYGAMKTGLTMSTTTMLAFIMLFILALITHIPLYYQISAVAVCGLIGDMISTWGLNAAIVIWDAERQVTK
ncbi:MAG: hypothetical protein NT157_01745 [Candidatus Micrarchaeota archaeon]|nr:hypothetical protein [Candidatus Micrarchaeota archaeon]